jgi:hypothetical protein
MSELEIALFVVIFGSIGVCISAATGTAFLFSQRLSRVEVVIALLSEKAAKILHSPHTPELDSYIEKDEAGLLTKDDVPRYVELLTEIENNRDEPKGNRLAAVLTHIKVSRQFNLSIPPINSELLIKKDK